VKINADAATNEEIVTHARTYLYWDPLIARLVKIAEDNESFADDEKVELARENSWLIEEISAKRWEIEGLRQDILLLSQTVENLESQLKELDT